MAETKPTTDTKTNTTIAPAPKPPESLPISVPGFLDHCEQELKK